MINNKKDDHVELAQKFYKEPLTSDFDNLRFIHHSFPEIGLDDVSISTSFATFSMEQPFFVNAMTGGSDMTKSINEKLAIVARETNIPMASGSLSATLKDPSLVDSFKIIRKVNPKGLIFANLGAEHTIESARRVIDILEADALQIHCNAPQELIMPEGDRDFSSWLNNIENMVAKIDIPIIVKEVGFGMSSKTIKQLMEIGVQTIDISGSGGTNFAKIENYRRDKSKYNYLEDFGQSTVVSLLEGQEFINKVEIIGSGGIRNPMDIVKVISLGAKAVGIAGLFLDMVLNKDIEGTVEEINNWKYQIKSIMTLLGKRNLLELQNADILISGNTKEWCLARKIEYINLANRSK